MGDRFRLLGLAVASIFVLASPRRANAQTPEGGPTDGRVISKDAVAGLDELESTIRRLEQQNSGRRWFVVVSEEDERPWVLAEKIAVSWDRAPVEPWAPK